MIDQDYVDRIAETLRGDVALEPDLTGILCGLMPMPPTAELTVDKELAVPGESVTLSWTTTGADDVEIRVDPGPDFGPPLPADGQIITEVNEDTIYELVASNDEGVTRDAVFVDVQELPSPPVKEVTGLWPEGFTVPAGEIWEIRIGTVLEAGANIIVLGILRIRGSGDAANPTTLRFVGANEALFVGGGKEVLDTDVGLWVMGDGVLDIQGTPRAGWNRTGTDPSWQEGDELILCPTDPGDYDGFAPYTGEPVPMVGPYSAEVLNLTRDIVIEGTPEGRSHILIRSTQPQILKHFMFRFMGPRRKTINRKGEPIDGDPVLGRWGLHFHHCGDGSRGSIVEGVVARDNSAHSFVPHESHGIVQRDCIAFDCFQTPFWWDRADNTAGLLWDRCVAAKIDHIHKYEKHGGGGFVLGRSPDNDDILRDCVAVGVKLRSGFDWRDNAKKTQWITEGTNVSHNNQAHGARTWHNSAAIRHDANGFVFYRNKGAGIEHGAYGTAFWHWSNVHILENESAGVVANATAKEIGEPDRPDGYRMSFENFVIEDQPDKPWLLSPGRPIQSSFPVLFKDIQIVNGSMEVVIDEGNSFGLFDLVNVTDEGGVSLEPNDINIKSVLPGFLLRCQRPDETAWQIDHEGNVTENIPAFYPRS